MTAKHCLDCGETFEAGRAPAASRPLRRLPSARVAPAVAVTLYGGICRSCAGVTPESPPQAAQEAAGRAMTDHARQWVHCTDSRHAASLPRGRYCPIGKHHVAGYRRTCQHFEPGA